MKVLVAVFLIVVAVVVATFFYRSYKLGQFDAAIGMVHRLVDAEAKFAQAHPKEGYTCNLSELNADGEAMKAVIGTGEWQGYSFEIRECKAANDQKLHATYEIIARPLHGGEKVCADQSQVVRFYEPRCDEE